MLKKGDFFIILIVIIMTVVSFVGVLIYKGWEEDGRKVALIIRDNEEIKRIDLDAVDEPWEYTVSGDYSNTILVERGRVRFKEADCPDEVCVDTGWLYKKGDMAVCLPNRIMIKIEGEPEDVDIVTY
ncbi:MAG TPA: NusG domain II-containing protein [Acetivibrio sp.]|nr:NusG domain II-containing protein [Acetivibrio sp.]